MDGFPTEIYATIYSLMDSKTQAGMRATAYRYCCGWKRHTKALKVDVDELEELCADVHGFLANERTLGSVGYGGIEAIELSGDYMDEGLEWDRVCRMAMAVAPKVINIWGFQMLKVGSWDRVTRLISPKCKVLRLKNAVSMHSDRGGYALTVQTVRR
jgi:hypothetical protein